MNTADDAGVFLLTDDMALVQTIDLLTPMVEEPYTFGRIAATNSLSDVYAMGGQPLTALNIVGFPAPMDKAILSEILRGAQDAVKQADALIIGGHTFNDKEIKFGLAVTGTIAPKKIITNAGARVGDVLVLTKPLGTGVFAQMMMKDEVIDQEFYQAAVDSMSQLNRSASEIMTACQATACTDITGYGLLGHAQEMAEASGKRLKIFAQEVPLLPKARELAKRLIDPGVLMNENSFGAYVEWQEEVPEEIKNILYESESSGGLLVCLNPANVQRFISLVQERQILAKLIGQVIEGTAGTIEVVW